MGLLSKLLSQCRKPRGWTGRVLAGGMNRAHAPMTRWVLSRFMNSDVRSVLDVGCGGGAAISWLATLLPQAELHGVDYSPDSLRIAARKNKRLIEQGRVSIYEAGVSNLPFEEPRFDLIYAIESHFFWPDLHQDLREIHRVLKPGGIVALAGGVYFGGKFDKRNRKFALVGGMNCQTLPELGDALRAAGYTEVKVHEEWDKGWFCVAGHKPGADVTWSLARQRFPLTRNKE